MTPQLFTRWPDAPALSAASVRDVESVIKVLGLAPTKARNLVAMAQVSGAVARAGWDLLSALVGCVGVCRCRVVALDMDSRSGCLAMARTGG